MAGEPIKKIAEDWGVSISYVCSAATKNGAQKRGVRGSKKIRACQSCGTENRDGAKYCDQCGKKIKSEPEVMADQLKEIISVIADFPLQNNEIQTLNRISKYLEIHRGDN